MSETKKRSAPKRGARKRAAKGVAEAEAEISCCRAVVWVDSSRLREEMHQDYESSRRLVQDLQGNLDRFHSVDVPSFHRWVQKIFGAVLVRMREGQQELNELEDIVAEVRLLVFFEEISEAEAYERVMRVRERRKQGLGAEEEEGDEADWVKEDEAADEHGQEHKGQKESQQDNGRHGDGFWIGGGPAEQPKPKKSKKLKALYRALVQRLHPDRNPDLSEGQKERWLEVQRAYQEGDEARLEMLLTTCQMETEEGLAKSSVSLLQMMTKQFKSAARKLRRELKRWRSDPAWDFSSVPVMKRAALEKKMRVVFRERLETMERQLKGLRDLVQEWEERTARARKRSTAAAKRSAKKKSVSSEKKDFFHGSE